MIFVLLIGLVILLSHIFYLMGTTVTYKGAMEDWANRGHGMYVTTRDRVVNGAKGTTRYVRDVADAVTRRSRQHVDATLKSVGVQGSASTGHPRKAV